MKCQVGPINTSVRGIGNGEAIGGRELYSGRAVLLSTEFSGLRSLRNFRSLANLGGRGRLGSRGRLGGTVENKRTRMLLLCGIIEDTMSTSEGKHLKSS